MESGEDHWNIVTCWQNCSRDIFLNNDSICVKELFPQNRKMTQAYD